MKKLLILVLGSFVCFSACTRESSSEKVTELRQRVSNLEDSLNRCMGVMVDSYNESDNGDAEMTDRSDDATTSTTSGTSRTNTKSSNSITDEKNAIELPHNDDRYVARFYQVEYRNVPSRLPSKKGTPGIFPEGTDRPLTERDLKFLSRWGLKIMENEIYARHGMTFDDEELKQHFKYEDWYKPVGKNISGKLSVTEKNNLDFIHGYKFTPYIPS